jgi:HK97 family phage portal protein
LCGVSPITACGLAALQGLNIQNNSAKFFANGSLPGGVLTAPALIDDTTARRLKDEWEQNYRGENIGKVAVLGDGLEYKPMTVNANDAQLIAQLRWTAENICSCFHVPPYMIGVGPPPNYNNIEALNQQYYSQCLQSYIQAIETLLDEGLGLTQLTGRPYRTEFDLDELLRMDTRTKVSSWSELVKAGIAAPNEARLMFNLGPTEGGEAPFLQQQNYSLEDLSRRSEGEGPLALPPPKAPLPAPKQDSAEPIPPKMLPPPPNEWANAASILKEVADNHATA